MLINASQVTNPSIDPLREPMETKTFLGRKPTHIHRDAEGDIVPSLPPQLELSTPILFSAMSYGSISYNALIGEIGYCLVGPVISGYIRKRICSVCGYACSECSSCCDCENFFSYSCSFS